MICAQEAWWQLKLDEVLMMPMGKAPHREIEPEPGPQTRLELCRLATEDVPWLSVSDLEVTRVEASFTADTLRQAAELFAGDSLTLLLGADQAAALGSWREPEAVLELATVAVAAREGMEREAVLRHLDGLGGREANIVFFEMPRIDVSSTLVRGRVGEGQPIDFLVPGSVAEVVAARGLYAGDAA